MPRRIAVEISGASGGYREKGSTTEGTFSPSAPAPDPVSVAENFAELALLGLDYARLPGPPDAARYFVRLEGGEELVVQVECVRTAAP